MTDNTAGKPMSDDKPTRTLCVVSHVRALRLACGLTQAQLAKLAGLTMFTISRLEQGSPTNDRISTAIRVADSLGVTLNDLYTAVFDFAIVSKDDEGDT